MLVDKEVPSTKYRVLSNGPNQNNSTPQYFLGLLRAPYFYDSCVLRTRYSVLPHDSPTHDSPRSRNRLADHFRKAANVHHQLGELSRQQRLRTVRQSFFGASMNFDVNAVGAGRHGRPSHGGDQVRPAGRV